MGHQGQAKAFRRPGIASSVGDIRIFGITLKGFSFECAELIKCLFINWYGGTSVPDEKRQGRACFASLG